VKHTVKYVKYKVRSFTAGDQQLLWEVLFHSLYVPAGGTPFERGILDEPAISIYAKDWGRETDLGLLAVSEAGQPLGAVWMRLLAGDEKGFGYVDDQTPELGMAVFPGNRGRGIGTDLLNRLLLLAAVSHKQISLSVSKNNPARHLYGRFGFKTVANDETSLVMLKRFEGG
jgi:ribosomal protein S18 acetylase RimI-like enzyme